MSKSRCSEYLLLLTTCVVLVLAVQARSPPRRHLCWNYRCRPGYVCKVIQPKCIRAPCPDARPVCVKRETPLEKCPPPKRGVFGPCVVRCRGDHECGPSQRCCGSCPRKCTNVASVKKGQCPIYPSLGRSRRRCGRPCKRDSDCFGVRKCCKAGRCGKMCMMPRIYHWFYHMFQD
ncbi:perlwapin-like [Gigantopelta aegis]|uniref:perlwapin-like n=1 Tax=Gigantopelta aegis TaxID=1735272 RepID=UPI001B88BA21|nr:perlwapin-like [Gigantopelta aegis]